MEGSISKYATPQGQRSTIVCLVFLFKVSCFGCTLFSVTYCEIAEMFGLTVKYNFYYILCMNSMGSGISVSLLRRIPVDASGLLGTRLSEL